VVALFDDSDEPEEVEEVEESEDPELEEPTFSAGFFSEEPPSAPFPDPFAARLSVR
jgi:hypothetical protein